MNAIDRAVNRRRIQLGRAEGARRTAEAEQKRRETLELARQIEAEIPKALSRLKAKGYPGATTVTTGEFVKRTRAAWTVASVEVDDRDGYTTEYYYLISTGKIVHKATYHYMVCKNLAEGFNADKLKKMLYGVCQLGK